MKVIQYIGPILMVIMFLLSFGLLGVLFMKDASHHDVKVAPGINGTKGPRGFNGSMGPRGYSGGWGARGPKGDKGPPGLSCNCTS